MRRPVSLRQCVFPALMVWVAACLAGLSACQPADQTVIIDGDDIGGVVTGPSGPEAGVWVIAETTDLPTRLIKIVVTDDQGRYLLPDLPDANYSVWVRGYGLVDSEKVQASPGASLHLTAVAAPDARAAAQYYPAGYWYSLIHVPEANEFPGTGDDGNGISENLTNQAQWVRLLKSGGCTACHQLGTPGTRAIPAALGQFESSVAAWERRLQSGQAGGQMSNALNGFGRQRVLAMFADWTDRIAAGEVPEAPPRPQGVERNVVITQWD
ncbi:MAG: carboxypeptidase regulatory-like domain-containing protein, partial [Gemmatimonadetes bacterium]|nr:carboxypeptidase regulatory-like domain-containing protein [Gemmatimonadota bacterium]